MRRTKMMAVLVFVGMLVPAALALDEQTVRQQGSLKACVARYQPHFLGKVNLHLFLSAGGNVSLVQIQARQLHQAAARCIQRVVRRWRFSHPQAGATTLSLFFSFSPTTYAS